MILFEEFKKIDIRIGKIVEAQQLENVQYVTHKLIIDLGELGKKVSFVNIKKYKNDQLLQKLVICVINLPVKKIGKELSEVLLLGTPDKDGECILLEPDSSDAIVGNSVY
ncbi:MAG TPA: tRNA-binding protein [Patescibacteria group bacterium]